jgi:hypothetical protein
MGFYVKNQVEHINPECGENGEFVVWKLAAHLLTTRLQSVSNYYMLFSTKLCRNTVGNMNWKRSYLMWLNPTISLWVKEILCTGSSLYPSQLRHELGCYMHQTFILSDYSDLYPVAIGCPILWHFLTKTDSNPIIRNQISHFAGTQINLKLINLQRNPAISFSFALDNVPLQRNVNSSLEDTQ